MPILTAFLDKIDLSNNMFEEVFEAPMGVTVLTEGNPLKEENHS